MEPVSLPDMPGPRLVEVAGNGQEHALESGEQIVGRGVEAAVVVDHEDVSRRHARITVSDQRVLVEDLDSKNGVFFNGTRVTEPTVVSHGDRLSLGRVELELVHPAARVKAALARRGEATVTRMRDDLEVAPVPPGLVLPFIGVLVFAGLVAAMLLL